MAASFYVMISIGGGGFWRYVLCSWRQGPIIFESNNQVSPIIEDYRMPNYTVGRRREQATLPRRKRVLKLPQQRPQRNALKQRLHRASTWVLATALGACCGLGVLVCTILMASCNTCGNFPWIMWFIFVPPLAVAVMTFVWSLFFLEW